MTAPGKSAKDDAAPHGVQRHPNNFTLADDAARTPPLFPKAV
jgi:hypothetical protein